VGNPCRAHHARIIKNEVIKMAEQKALKNVDDLLNQINEFEKTLKNLQTNVETLKSKLMSNKEKYGSDISKWPRE
jgi:archaellum component FlaC